jgi:hypothetical protein
VRPFAETRSSRRQLEVRYTWDVSVRDAFVSESLVARSDLPARIDRPLYRGYVPALVAPGSSAIVLGAAQAAVDELVRLAPGKKNMSGATLAAHPRIRAPSTPSPAPRPPCGQHDCSCTTRPGPWIRPAGQHNPARSSSAPT